MNKKLLSLLVTLVAMFGCLSNANAEKLTLTIDKGRTTTDNVATLTLSNDFDVDNDAFKLDGKIILGSSSAGTLSIVSNRLIKITNITISGKLGIAGSASYSTSENSENSNLFTRTNPFSSPDLTGNISLNSTFERKNIVVTIHGDEAANFVPTIYINSIELEYEKYDYNAQCTKEWTEAGVDPTNGGKYYIYHPATKTFLNYTVRSSVFGSSASLSSTTNAYDAFLWEITKSGNSYNMKSGNYYFNLARSNSSTANPNLSTNSQTTEIKKSSTNTALNAYKIWRQTSPTRYLNLSGTTYSGANGEAESNDWVFISEEQMNAYKAAHDAKVGAYKTAWDKALALGNGERAEDIQGLDEAMEQYQGANCDDFETKTAGLNNLTKVILNIKDNCYGTFVSQFDVTLPDGVVAFGVKSSTADKVTLEQIPLTDNVLSAGNPVIVKHEDGTGVRKAYYGVKGIGTVTKNGLLGFYETGTTIADGCYVLQSQSDGVQKFYVVASGNDGALTTSTKNRCCLPAGSIQGAKVLNLVFEEETAVCNIESEATIVGYYSINGSKLVAPQAGVNIVKMSNGSVKKVFVK